MWEFFPRGKGFVTAGWQANSGSKREDIKAAGDLPYLDRFPEMCVGCDGCEKLLTHYF